MMAGTSFYVYAYHKGLGRFLGAFPSDTAIFTSGNDPAGFNGPFNPDFRTYKVHKFNLKLGIT